MNTIGIDPHKRVNEAFAIDRQGQEVGRWRGPNDASGWTELQVWASQLGSERQFGVEGAGSLGRGLAQHLLGGQELVYEVNPRWTAMVRVRARRSDKSDRLDARAVALFVRQEAPDLPRVEAEDETVALDVLATEREAAVGEATRLQNQIHALLQQLDPHYRDLLPSMKTPSGLARLKGFEPTPDASVAQQARAASVRRLALRLELALAQVDDLSKQIAVLASPRFTPLTEICGVGVLTAGILAGILGPGRRFANDAELAKFAGAAPIETSSAERIRHRLNRGGNRRLNAVLYRIVLTQARYSRQARAYLDRRMSEGRTRKEAFRALKRYVIRAIFNIWVQCMGKRPDAGSPRASCACT
jgi:transposase